MVILTVAMVRAANLSDFLLYRRTQRCLHWMQAELTVSIGDD